MNFDPSVKYPVSSMDALTIEITLSSEGEYIYKVWPKDVETAAQRYDEDSEGDDNGGICTGNMTAAIGMAADAALAVVRAHFSDNCFNNDVCPSSLDENGEPMTDGETDHKWSEEMTPIIGSGTYYCEEDGCPIEQTDDSEDDILFQTANGNMFCKNHFKVECSECGALKD